MAFLHPVLGAITIGLTVWVMSRGLTARAGTKAASHARRVHRRWAPVALALMVASGLSGTLSTLWLRPDLELGETWHLAVGWTTIGLMGSAGLLTRGFTRDPRLRRIHPWIGMVAAVAALLQGILGIELLP